MIAAAAQNAPDLLPRIILLFESLGEASLGAYKDACLRRRFETHLRRRNCRGEDYLELLKTSEEERGALLEALTIHVSEFFRDPHTFAFLSSRTLPALMERALSRGQACIRAWSLGCACGEEPYSLALLWKDLEPAGLELDILATDISEAALGRAEAGIFDAGRLREVPPAMLAAHFRPRDGAWQIHPEIRAMVHFEQRDILDPQEYPPADLVLCRNLLIYLSRTQQDEILRRLIRSLGPGGYLVLGHNESPGPAVSELFAPVAPGHRIFQPRPPSGPSD